MTIKRDVVIINEIHRSLLNICKMGGRVVTINRGDGGWAVVGSYFKILCSLLLLH